MTPGASRTPSFLPREHGAYAQVIFPQLTALALGRPQAAALLLAVAVAAAFVAHEPVLVLVGGRGGRARRELAEHARRRLTLLAAVGSISGIAGLWLAPAAARLGALVPAVLAAGLIPLTLRRRERTLPGELLVALTLSSALVPVALAADVAPRTAAIAAAIWTVVFIPGVLTVRAIIAGAKARGGRAPERRLAPAASLAIIALALALDLSGRLTAGAAAAMVPTALVTLVFLALGAHPRNLRRIGWSLVAGNVAALAALVLGLR